MNFRTWLESVVHRHASDPFLLFQNEIITFELFDRRVNALACAFADLGIRPGDNVVLLLPNHPAYLYAWFGLVKCGARAVMINTGLVGAGLSHLLRLSGARLAVADAALATHLEHAAQGTALETVVWHPAPPEGQEHGLHRLLAAYDGQPAPPVDLTGRDGMSLPHTSGTTGPAKLCLLSHRYYLALAQAARAVFQLTPADVVYNPLPLFHINPHYAVMGALAAGCRLVIPERFSASRFWDEVAHYGATVVILHLWPLGVLKKQPPGTSVPSHRVRLAFPADREFMERFDIPAMATVYGSTEAGGITTGRVFRQPLPVGLGVTEPLSSITGRPRDDIEVGIVDQHDELRSAGEIGEIVVRPKRPHVIFDGYFNMPERTLQSFRNLWFHTGDLGFFDERGELHFLGRAADSIRVRGEFVHIDELETLIRTHPAVHDCAVVGVAGEIADQEILAILEPRDGHVLDPADLVRFLAGKIADFMVPRYYRIQPLPRVPGTGKVQKERLDRSVEAAWDRRQPR
ncbi:MAG: AMP-binding protein [Armatimonadota bacterium]|nr:AMP-binding protein [Armatimonadota bacterium]MDR7487164.1 AMP-binding protein [Armatimonadota bacterium]MDR7535014.1 AMP-binding protein [Armatimonadota bacterium]